MPLLHLSRTVAQHTQVCESFLLSQSTNCSVSHSIHCICTRQSPLPPSPPSSNLSEIFGTNNLIMCHTCKGLKINRKIQTNFAPLMESLQGWALSCHKSDSPKALYIFMQPSTFILSTYIFVLSLHLYSLHVYSLYTYMYLTYVIYMFSSLYTFYIYTLSTFICSLHFMHPYTFMSLGALWRDQECIKFGIQKCKIYVPGVQDE